MLGEQRSIQVNRRGRWAPTQTLVHLPDCCLFAEHSENGGQILGSCYQLSYPLFGLGLEPKGTARKGIGIKIY